MRFSLIFALLACCLSCSSDPQHERPVWLEKLSASNGSLGMLPEADCLARDGIWSGTGEANVALCSKTIRDSGKPCSDHSQCQTLCKTHSQVEAGHRTTGTCYASYSIRGGCIQGVAHGHAEGIVCLDP